VGYLVQSCSSVFLKDDLQLDCIYEMVTRTIRRMESLWETGSQYTKSRAGRRYDHCL